MAETRGGLEFLQAVRELLRNLLLLAPDNRNNPFLHLLVFLQKEPEILYCRLLPYILKIYPLPKKHLNILIQQSVNQNSLKGKRKHGNLFRGSKCNKKSNDFELIEINGSRNFKNKLDRK